MSQQSERLFAILSQIRDDHVEQAGRYMGRRRKPWRRWAALAACLAVAVLGIGTFTGRIPLFQMGGSSGGSGSDGASTFMSYAGPIMPLTLAKENPAITAQRDITLDFDPWVPTWQSNEERAAQRTDLTEEERQEVLASYQELYPEGGQYQYSHDILVTDSYVLTNTSGQAQDISLLYPFVASLRELEQERPALTVDGVQQEGTLHVGAYAGFFEGVWEGAMEGSPEGSANLDYAESWQDFQAILADGSYLSNALGDGPDVSGIPVVVYEFTDPYGPAEDEAAGRPNPSIRVSFDLDYDQTTILGYGFHSGRYDRENGTMIQGFSIPQEGELAYGQPFYLMVVGEDVENMEIAGYVTGGTDEGTPTLEGCGVTVERYESDLDTMLRTILPRIWGEFRSVEETWEGRADFETYYRAFLEHLLAYGVLSPQGTERYGAGWLEELSSDVGTIDRVCWLEVQVAIPAGGSVTAAASLLKEGSFDYACTNTENRGVYGYDMVTRMGSNLACTAQRATLEDRGQVTLVRQNFGFDLEQGVRTVTLDQAVEQYYLEVKRLAGTIPEAGPEH